MDVLRAMLTILVILLIAILWAGIIAVFMWITSIFIKRLLQRKLVDRQLQRIKDWFKHNKSYFEALWELISIIIDPVFYGYAIYALVNRMESIANYTRTNPQYNFWQILNLDSENDKMFYVIFTIIFCTWILAKAWSYRKQREEQKKVTGYLEAIAKKIGVDKDESSKPNDHFESVL